MDHPDQGRSAPVDIRDATLTAIYLFDVAEQIDLRRLREGLGIPTGTRATSASVAPAYLQYQTPPLMVDGDVVAVASMDGFRARFKFFEYGVVSLALSRPFTGGWTDLVSRTS